MNLEIRPILSALARSKTGAILVAIQVAISLAILANAVYIVNLRLAVMARPSGIANESEMFIVSISNQKLGDHAAQIAQQKQDEATMRGVSGVTSVVRVSQVPLSNSGNISGVSLDRKQVTPSSDVSMYVAADSLVKIWGLKLLEGRDFVAGDYHEIDLNTSKEFPDVVIITKDLANKLFTDKVSAVGKVIYFDTGDDANATRIIGVVEHLQTVGARPGPGSEDSVILPRRYSNSFYSVFSLRSEPGQRDRAMKDVETALRTASASPLIIKTRSMDEDRSRRYRADKGLSWMLIAVSVLLLLVTASGIVGISSLWVSQRRKHIGVRRALGARRIDILRYFITENIMITSLGIFCGTALAVGLNQLLVSKLELTKLPIPYLLGGGIIFWILGIIAVVGPAARAAAISPATATRST